MTRSRRGAMLLETLIAVAVFAATAFLVLSLARESLDALDRAERRAMAVDLARTALAQLEAGLVNLADLRAGRIDGDAEGVDADARRAGDLGSRLLRLQVQTRPSAYRGLSLVEVRVSDRDAPDDAAPLCTLRQLVRLRGADAEEAPPQDELLRGLEGGAG